MGHSRKIFTDIPKDFSVFDEKLLDDLFYEITSGRIAFGNLSEWSDWFHYLLSEYVAADNSKPNCLPEIISAFMAFYPGTVSSEPYKGFMNDALNSLGRQIMEPYFWYLTDGLQFNQPYGGHCFSPAMFFCLKYLPPACLPGWLDSFLAIPSVTWRKQIITWLVGSHPLLVGAVRQIGSLGNPYPDVIWANSFLLKDKYGVSLAQDTANVAEDFISEDRRRIFLDLLQKKLSPDIYASWGLKSGADSHFENEFAYADQHFLSLYF